MFVRSLHLSLRLPGGRSRTQWGTVTTKYAPQKTLDVWNTPGHQFTKDELDEIVSLNVICGNDGVLCNMSSRERLACLGFSPDHFDGSSLSEVKRMAACGQSFALASLARVVLANLPHLTLFGQPPVVNVCCAFSGIGGAEVVCGELARIGKLHPRTIVSIELDDELRAVTRRWFEKQEHLKDVVFIELGDITTIFSERFRNLCVSIGGIQLFIGARRTYTTCLAGSGPCWC